MAEPSLEAVRDARRELDEVVREIQAIPGFETFLAAPTFEDVASAAAIRPLIYIAPTEVGGLALIVRGTDVVHVRLDDLTTDAVRERLVPYLDAYTHYRMDSAAGWIPWNAAVAEATAWAWDAVIGPILDVVADGEEVVVIAGGVLGLLPLHAAWEEDPATPTGRRYALDHVTFSYAPNARALGSAEVAARPVTGARTLVIVDPRPVSAPVLPFAAAEGTMAAAAFSAATLLRGGEATVANFTREAQRTDVLHLACHGTADLASPLDSGLLLAGNQWVTLRDLFGLTLDIRLAVLSACETALPGAELPDEVVALPTGLLQAGVAGVVASQWAVPDLGTAILMTEFYRRLKTDSPAVALRAAQQWTRDTTNGQKIDAFDDALAGGMASLPPGVGEALVDALAFRDPDALGHAELSSWAGFTHVGV